MHLDRIWAALAIDTCIKRGVDHFFLAPGSRCTPLTMAVAQNAAAKVTQHFDERGLAFATLGFARATGNPGVFICTSGTAVVNAFPAVVEASVDHVPMLLLTADRPPELRDTGTNQTIDQQRIFGGYPRWFFDMPCPTDAIDPGFVRSQIDSALDRSSSGPVHLNWMFREPFAVEDTAIDLSPFPLSKQTVSRNTSDAIEIPGGDTLIALGGCRANEANSALLLAQKLGTPIVSDIASGLRCGSPEVPAKYDLPNPSTIIHVGGRMVSKAWMRYIGELSATNIVHLTGHPSRIDPNHQGVQRVVTQLDRIHETISLTESSSVWFRQAWDQAELARRGEINAIFGREGNSVSEPLIAFQLGQFLSANSGLFLGNSTPVRDMDWFARWDHKKNIHVGANRGASGIDGLIATAVGFAKGLKRPTTLLLGDLAALHDLNSLSLVRHSDVHVIVLIVNNHGGGVFDLLPIAKQTQYFERYFATPHEYSFADAATTFGLAYRRPKDMLAFESEYKNLVNSNSSAVIELIADRKYNATVRQRINDAIK